jgi:hypothetical protein
LCCASPWGPSAAMCPLRRRRPALPFWSRFPRTAEFAGRPQAQRESMTVYQRACLAAPFVIFMALYQRAWLRLLPSIKDLCCASPWGPSAALPPSRRRRPTLPLWSRFPRTADFAGRPQAQRARPLGA